MELAFQQSAVTHLQKLASQTASQEETAEATVPDGLPDVGGKDFDERLLQEVLERLAAEDYAPQDEQEREELHRRAMRGERVTF